MISILRALSLAVFVAICGACADLSEARLPWMMGPQSVDAGSSGAVVPLDLERLVPIVDVAFEGGVKARLIVDTGARFSSITPALAERLQVESAELGLRERVGSVLRSLETVRVPALTMGKLAVAAQVVVIEPDAEVLLSYGVSGILGINAFADMVVSFDFPNAQLRVRRRAGEGIAPAKNRWIHRWEGDSFRPRVPLIVRRPSAAPLLFDAVVDTGSNGSLRAPTALALADLHGKAVGRSRDRTLYGWQEWDLLQLDGEVVLGPWILSGLLVATHASGDRLLREDRGVLGMQCLIPTVLTIDLRARTLAIEVDEVPSALPEAQPAP